MMRPGCRQVNTDGTIPSDVLALSVTQVFTVQALGDVAVGSWSLPQFEGCDRLTKHRLGNLSGDCTVRVDSLAAHCTYDYRIPGEATYIHCTDQVLIIAAGGSVGSSSIVKVPTQRWFLTGIPGSMLPFTQARQESRDPAPLTSPRVVIVPTPTPGSDLTPRTTSECSIEGSSSLAGASANHRILVPKVIPLTPPTPMGVVEKPAGVGPVVTSYGFILINGKEVPDAGSEPYDVTDWLLNGVNTIEIRHGSAESNLYLVPGYYTGKLSKVAFGLVTITYSWPSLPDLDTRTGFLGDVVGFGYGYSPRSGQYMKWSGDNQGVAGDEVVIIDLATAWHDGLITTHADISCGADWYPPRGGKGPATMKVVHSIGGTTKILFDGPIYPGSTATPATTVVYRLRVGGDDSGLPADEETPAVLAILGQCYRFIGYPEWRRHYSKTVEVDFTVIATRYLPVGPSTGIGETDIGDCRC